MGTRETFLSKEAIGDSLDGVEALIKKHEDFDKSIRAQASRIPILVTKVYCIYVQICSITS